MGQRLGPRVSEIWGFRVSQGETGNHKVGGSERRKSNSGGSERHESLKFGGSEKDKLIVEVHRILRWLQEGSKVRTQEMLKLEIHRRQRWGFRKVQS